MEKRFEIKYEVYSRDFSKVYSSFIKNLKIFREHKSILVVIPFRVLSLLEIFEIVLIFSDAL